ncbi:LytR/AlgR family response regulator transcription factor [Streptococcus equi]|uniref:LytR/AlgR family response regulator transcription factor n=1 Tax=Streptococcus equi TaxID=1336 RepID=UPI001BB7FAEC|nr:LytTR family DNA-binding domain-containing protein [Streptococcus equi]QTC13222.1 hypothetical protein HIEAAJJG_02018 [Streptococcus equi subsp. zooepidemicus]
MTTHETSIVSIGLRTVTSVIIAPSFHRFILSKHSVYYYYFVKNSAFHVIFGILNTTVYRIMGGTMLKIALCDDNKAFATAVEDLLYQYNQLVPVELDIYEDPYQLIQSLSNDYHIFLLDIEMDNMSGIALAEHIRKDNLSAIIIFLTSHKEYMENIFHVQTFDYLIKPLNEPYFFECLNRALRVLELDKKFFTFSSCHSYYSLSLNDIIYFEKEGRKVLIHTKDKTYSTFLSTKALLKELPEQFIQTHHSYVFNVNYFYKFENNDITLTIDNTRFFTIPISRKFKKGIQENIFSKLRRVNGY